MITLNYNEKKKTINIELVIPSLDQDSSKMITSTYKLFFSFYNLQSYQTLILFQVVGIFHKGSRLYENSYVRYFFYTSKICRTTMYTRNIEK